MEKSDFLLFVSIFIHFMTSLLHCLSMLMACLAKRSQWPYAKFSPLCKGSSFEGVKAV